jgi:hypothetical protein
MNPCQHGCDPNLEEGDRISQVNIKLEPSSNEASRTGKAAPTSGSSSSLPPLVKKVAEIADNAEKIPPFNRDIMHMVPQQPPDECKGDSSLDAIIEREKQSRHRKGKDPRRRSSTELMLLATPHICISPPKNLLSLTTIAFVFVHRTQ